jgi:hypothetical protein
MRRRLKKSRWVLSAATVLGLVYVTSPCVMLWQMVSALQHGDVVALERGVDWPALRAGLKQDISDGVIGPVSTQLTSNTLPPFGASFITGIADSIVDREATASNLVAMMHQTGSDETMPNPLGMIEHAFFESPRVFVVSLRDADDEGHVRLRLELQGFSWRITRAWIPQDMIERVSQRT